MDPEFRVIEGFPDYWLIIDLINAEWPAEFGEKSDEEKISDMIESHDTEKDSVSFMYYDGQIIGFYRYTAWPRTARQTDTAHIYDIAVLPSMQKRGFGTLLMLNLISRCKDNGFRKLLSRSFKNNEASIGLHKSLGFLEGFETDDSIVWELNIS